MCWDAVRIDFSCIWIVIIVTLTWCRLTYAELYVTLGRVFRQRDDLKTSRKAREGLLYKNYFSSYIPKKHNDLYSSALDVVDSASGFLRSRDTYLSKRT